MKARPAPARFPYLNHRTVAEVWDDEARIAALPRQREYYPRPNARRKVA